MTDMNLNIKFGVIRKYCSRIDRVSICIKETSDYENFLHIDDVPDTYNDYWLYGFGVIESEFYDDAGRDWRRLLRCMEIMVSSKPKFDENGELM